MQYLAFLQQQSTSPSIPLPLLLLVVLLLVLGFALYRMRSMPAKPAPAWASGSSSSFLGSVRAVLGGVAGGVVGYLLGKSPLLSFDDVITRGTNLQGINELMRPAAEAASNWMLAGTIVGVMGALVVNHFTTKRSHTSTPIAESPLCPDCGTSVPKGMQFCGKCGTALHTGN